jgi:hypothetical protein
LALTWCRWRMMCCHWNWTGHSGDTRFRAW